MIIINTGIPKSGTTLIFEYQKDLIRASYPINGLEEIKFHDGINTGFVSSVTNEIFTTLCSVESKCGSFVIKTHQPPEKNVKRLVEEYGAKVTCCYRDPRDTVLSALDHGKRTRSGNNPTGAFSDMFTIENSAKEVKNWAGIYQGWIEYGQNFMIKYEDLMADQLAILSSMACFLNLSVDKENLNQIYEKHEKAKESAHNFNKGTCYRWKTEMSESEIARCNEILSDEITMMGYALV